MTPVLDELIRALEKAADVLAVSSNEFDRAWAQHLKVDAVMVRLLRQSDRWRGEGQ